MAKPNVLILRTAGTNCDYETQHAFEKAGAETESVHINQLLQGKKSLDNYKILVIPGGFSYGDDLGAGKILAIQLQKLNLKKFAEEGKLVIGICNGFQVLVKLGLLPFSKTIKQEATLTNNDSGRFECRWIYLKNTGKKCIFTKGMDKIYLPIAHGEGKFFAEQNVISKMEENDHVVFRYVDENGELKGYPCNPNGSINNIASVCNEQGNVLGMMPHPERFIRKTQHPRWTREKLKEEGDGFLIFRNAVEYARRL